MPVNKKEVIRVLLCRELPVLKHVRNGKDLPDHDASPFVVENKNLKESDKFIIPRNHKGIDFIYMVHEIEHSLFMYRIEYNLIEY